MKRLILLTPFALLWLMSCKQEEKILVEKEVTFSIANPAQAGNSGGRVATTAEPKSVLVTIKDSDGTTVSDRKELTLYKFGENFLSLPLTLKTSGTSKYHLTEFMVVGADGKVNYATPKEGSKLAHLVSDALDIEFVVSKDAITTITPEVLEIDANANSADYGYGQFGFKIVKTISAVFSAFVEGVNNFELTSAHLKILGLRDTTSNNSTSFWIYETDLEAKANIIELKETPFYKITATKQGYETWDKTITKEQASKLEILFEKITDTVDVYVAGSHGGNAIYWKNGVPVTLNKGWSSYATSIKVFNNDVYVAISDPDQYPQYWKNKEKKFLPIPAGVIRGNTTDIIIREDGVHVCGDYVTQNNSKAAYWKNGTRTELQIPSPFTNAKTDKMTIDGSDVYITGYVLTWNTSLLTAALWKNGQFIPLPVPANYAVSRGEGVKVLDGHVYVSGYILDAPYPPNQARAVYWKDGALQFIEQTGSIASRLDVYNNTIYIPYTADDKTYYWKNDQRVLVDERARSIYQLVVSKGDVYLVGTYKENSSTPAVASYWVNGKRIPLQSEKESQAVSCFIVNGN
jgi:hypothetical protein